jgi:hypothetical protein
MNNYGFYVERKNESSQICGDREQICFIKGQGITTELSEYRYIDSLIEPGATYKYKLRQVDFDGSQSCTETMAITVTSVIELGSENLLGMARTNPFGNTSPTTTIDYTQLEQDIIKFKVTDMAGQTFKDFGELNKTAGKHIVLWDGKDSKGNQMPGGKYICMLYTSTGAYSGIVNYMP